MRVAAHILAAQPLTASSRRQSMPQTSSLSIKPAATPQTQFGFLDPDVGLPLGEWAAEFMGEMAEWAFIDALLSGNWLEALKAPFNAMGKLVDTPKKKRVAAGLLGVASIPLIPVGIGFLTLLGAGFLWMQAGSQVKATAHSKEKQVLAHTLSQQSQLSTNDWLDAMSKTQRRFARTFDDTRDAEQDTVNFYKQLAQRTNLPNRAGQVKRFLNTTLPEEELNELNRLQDQVVAERAGISL